MILKAGLVVGALGFGMILGYWGYFVVKYTTDPNSRPYLDDHVEERRG